MTRVVRLNANNLDIRRGILLSWIFLATHLPISADATDPLEADSWLHTMESKFRLLHCTEYQKTLYAAQQL
jgi:hypothetical protein